MSVTSATTTRHTHTHPHPHPHRTARRRSAVNLYRTPSHPGTALAGLAALTLSRPSNGDDGMERQDSRSSKASDEVSVVSAPARTRGGSRPGVGSRRKSQVHLAAGDHKQRTFRSSRSDTNLSRLGLTALARAPSRTNVQHAAEAEPEEAEWEEEDTMTNTSAASEKRIDATDDDESNADESGDGDDLVITTKRKRSVAPVAQGAPSEPSVRQPQPTDEEALDHQQTTRAMRGFDLDHPSAASAAPRARERSLSPTPSESGTLIAPCSVPTFTHPPPVRQGPSPSRQEQHGTPPPRNTTTAAAAPASRHLRTRNSHTSLRSLTSASLRTLPSTMMVGPHHPLSSPTSVRTFRVHSGAGASTSTGLAPPVVSGEIARGLWSTASNGGISGGSSSAEIDGLAHSNAPGASGKRPHAASASLRKASFSTPPSGITGGSRSASMTSAGSNPGSNGGGDNGGRLSAHSVAQKAARLPTLSSRSTAQQDSHERERETVNLVSRFIALPSSTFATSVDSAKKDSPSKSTAGAGGSIFPDSPFATAHKSLVRTMMEESARMLPTGAGGYGVGGGASGYHYDSHATTPRVPPSIQRSGTTFASVGTAAAGGGNGATEWVPGLTPFEMSVQRCLEQRKGAVRLATGESLAPLVG
ncbi:hypothetical protein QFC21_001157 [Naganishia friedmannii]|uniref:Uncharacterized protein n=1 Tax=Naganishia friedmannii TaxID=89922 RepID=A0ACC2W9D9_9TREE|nr:hypothetical protein QFC21_001157 [Naganishia friedmannii]